MRLVVVEASFTARWGWWQLWLNSSSKLCKQQFKLFQLKETWKLINLRYNWHDRVQTVMFAHNNKLSRYWDSATCEPLDAEIIFARMQNSTFLYVLVFLGWIWYLRIPYYYPGWVWHVCSHIDLSCHVSISTYLCCTMWLQSINDTDRQSNRCHSCSIWHAVPTTEV